MAHAGIIRFMSLRNASQERRLFCSLHPHPKLCKFFAISFDSAKAFDRKIHGSILQFAAEGDCSHQNESTATAESLWGRNYPLRGRPSAIRLKGAFATKAADEPSIDPALRVWPTSDILGTSAACRYPGKRTVEQGLNRCPSPRPPPRMTPVRPPPSESPKEKPAGAAGRGFRRGKEKSR